MTIKNFTNGRFSKIKIILRLYKYVRPYRALYFIIFLTTGLSAVLNLIPIYMIKPLTDKVFIQPISSSFVQRLQMLNFMVFLLLVVNIAQVLINSLKEYWKKWLSEKIGANIRIDLYAHLQTLPMKFYSNETTGDIQSNISYDTQFLNYFVVDQLMDIFIWVVMVLGIGLILFHLQWKLALFMLIPLPIIVLLSKLFGQKIIIAYRALLQQMSNMNTILFQAITGIAVVRTSVAEKKELLKFANANENALVKRLQTLKVDLFFLPLKRLLIVSSGTLIYWIGGKAVVSGKLSLGELMVFIGYIWQFYGPVESLGLVYTTFQNTIASAERVFKIFDIKPEIVNSNDVVNVPSVRGIVRFDNVTFSYDGNTNLFKDINIEVKPGEIIGITGPSGAGKSTMMYLLSRLYEVTQGTIYIDDIDVRKINIKSLREHVGVVLQDTRLFYDTIAENIAYARPDASLDEIVASAKAANAHDFIMRLPEAYDTLIGEGGAKLSGGERQRIAIARVLLKNPKIIIFDEATSALDLKSEMAIRTAIEKLAGKNTIIIISHRLSMLDIANKILVVQEGRITELNSSDRIREAERIINSFVSVKA